MLVVLQNLTSLLAQGSQNPVLQCDYVIVLILTGIDKLMLSNLLQRPTITPAVGERLVILRSSTLVLSAPDKW